ncbi:MAG: hypothetical protein IPI67_24740 [Myxococcales bacterium]|nr:hypothetical protein [Myxococcales bacterium]
MPDSAGPAAKMRGAWGAAGVAMLLGIGFTARPAHAQDSSSERHAGVIVGVGLGVERSDVVRTGAARDTGRHWGLVGIGRILSEDPRQSSSFNARWSFGLGADDSDGAAGELMMSGTYGLFVAIDRRWPVHGFHARVGLDGSLSADPRRRNHDLSLPVGEFGYGLYSRTVVSEVGGIGALEVVGFDSLAFDGRARFEDKRSLSPVFGGRAAMFTEALGFEMRFLRIAARRGRAIHQFDTLLCGGNGGFGCIRFQSTNTGGFESRHGGFAVLVVGGIGVARASDWPARRR